ncbi:MAG TPA: alpha/beta hydrolase [Thermoanaerobaculia bacterium]|jgi:pimeloyl-ACP methyl ester carboxylesterase
MKTAAIVALAAIALAATPAVAAKRKANMQSGYAPVNGLRMYYEIHGSTKEGQPPLLLLHGGGDTIDTCFGVLLPELARHRQVIAFEQQGFGRTADIAERPFTFEQSADDTAALLAHLRIPRADLLGFSNGGTIAAQVAIRHPRAVRKLILASTILQRDGAHPWLWQAMANAKIEEMPQPFKDAYRAVAPHPENLQSFFDKSVQRMRTFTDIPDAAIRNITAPAMVLIADNDIVRPEHAVATARLIPAAQLAILPGTEHTTVMKQTKVLIPMIEQFLGT